MVATEAAAATPSQAWAWEPRNRLLVVARRVLESPGIVHETEVIGDLNVRVGSLMEDQEAEVAPLTETADLVRNRRVLQPMQQQQLSKQQMGIKQCQAQKLRQWRRSMRRQQNLYRPPPKPPPWSSHPARVLCTYCFAGNRETRNSKVCAEKPDRSNTQIKKDAIQRVFVIGQ
jgi:hypothetical protein